MITEVFILVPALVGLKGNLEMTLAARLSTAVRRLLHVLRLTEYIQKTLYNTVYLKVTTIQTICPVKPFVLYE